MCMSISIYVHTWVLSKVRHNPDCGVWGSKQDNSVELCCKQHIEINFHFKFPCILLWNQCHENCVIFENSRATSDHTHHTNQCRSLVKFVKTKTKSHSHCVWGSHGWFCFVSFGQEMILMGVIKQRPCDVILFDECRWFGDLDFSANEVHVLVFETIHKGPLGDWLNAEFF